MTYDEFFEKLANGAKWDVGVSIARTNPLPLDANSVFKTLGDLTTYAETNPVAYPGQICSVISKEEVAAYQITNVGAERNIVKLAASSASGDIAQDVATLQSQMATVNGKLGDIDKKLGGIEDNAQVNKLEGISFKGSGDSGFTDLEIVEKKIKLDLSTYATKNDLVAIPKFAIEVVESLPIDTISDTTIYLVKRNPEPAPSGQGDFYDEYIHVNGNWELIGNTEVDLSNYVTSSDLADTLKGYVQSTTLTNTLADYVQTKELENYASIETVNQQEKTIQALTQAVSTKADASALEALTQTVNSKADTSALEALTQTVNSNTSTLEALTKTVNGKANTSDLTSLQETVTAQGETLQTKATTIKFENDTTHSYSAVNGVITLPAATADGLGMVKSSTEENHITVNQAGQMEVNNVNVNKLTQTEGEFLILNGGNASLQSK